VSTVTSWSKRWLRGTLALLYLGICAAAPLAHAAQYDPARSPAGQHLHAESDRSCPPAHNHDDCLICRTVDGPRQTVGDVASALISSSPAVAPNRCIVTLPATFLIAGALGARAPPRI
jgi:hypothetical protein